MSVYILQLRQGKKYVGYTISKVSDRVRIHNSGNGARWVAKYGPGKVERIIKTDDLYDEDKYVKKEMAINGINNVRGGSYSHFILNNNEQLLLKKEINNVHRVCFKCGSSDHFIKNCPY